jgi:REP element-mobilizing transposase RayT
LSKAPLRSVFLKTGRISVKYSHNNWYIKRGQASYFASTVGISEEIIRKYIEMQGKEDSGQALLEF